MPRTKVKSFNRPSALYPVTNYTLEVKQAVTLVRPFAVGVFGNKLVALVKASSTYGIAGYTESKFAKGAVL